MLHDTTWHLDLADKAQELPVPGYSSSIVLVLVYVVVVVVVVVVVSGSGGGGTPMISIFAAHGIDAPNALFCTAGQSSSRQGHCSFWAV